MKVRFPAVCLPLLFNAFAWGADPATPQRIPWSSSRIHGSPDPPKPFVAHRIFPKLEFNEALEIAFEPNSKRWFALERLGKIYSWPPDAAVERADLVADLKTLHSDTEQLFGIAFHPKFSENHQVFLTYNRGPAGLDDGTRLSRFTLSPINADSTKNDEPGTKNPYFLEPSSEQVLLTWRSGGHNGANLQFGPEGFLYISTGDSEVPSPPDPLNTGQDISDLLSSILRIDVDHADSGLAYAIPKDNPFVGRMVDTAEHKPKPARAETWAYGLRNPWKMSFDRATGRLWCGDVGWELWEMIHLIERGGNYGWSKMEASQPVRADAPDPPTPIRPPVVAHSHDEAASITGGYVYHGKSFPELEGAYIYGDWVTGKIWALWHDGKQVTRRDEIADTHHKIIAFGQDADGELVYLDYSQQGGLYELRRNQADKTGKFPTKLSDTGLFRDITRQQLADGVYAYDIRAKMWLDAGRGASESFLIGLPGLSRIKSKIDKKKEKDGTTRSELKIDWPKDSVLAKTIHVQARRGNRDQSLPVETQILHFDGNNWQGYSYEWDDGGHDAGLVGATGEERKITVTQGEPAKGTHELTWRFHSRAECVRCHNPWCGGALAFHPAQLKLTAAGPLSAKSDRLVLQDLFDLGLVDAPFVNLSAHEMMSAKDEGALADKARTWLHVNCSHCHRQNAGGAVTMMLNAELTLSQMQAIDVAPLQGGLGLTDPKLIQAGNPWNSAICVRMAKTGTGHMPIIGSREADVEGLNLIEDWVARMNDKVTNATALLPKDWSETLLKEKLATVDGAMQVLHAVDHGLIKESLRHKALEIAWNSPQPTVRDLFDRFLPDEKRVATLGPNPDSKKILVLEGNAARGSQLLSPQGKLATCFACHLINGAGRDFGPDLSKIGTRLKPEQILESLLQPSKVIAQGYQAVSVETTDGPMQVGFVAKEDAKELSLKTATGQTMMIAISVIKERTNLPASLMPEGLMQSLTAQEAADLLAFLHSLK